VFAPWTPRKAAESLLGPAAIVAVWRGGGAVC